MIFQSCYKEITQDKSSKLHGHGYLAKYPTRKEVFKDNIEVQKCAEAAAREKEIVFEAQVENLKQQLAYEAEEREREKEEIKRQMQDDLENAKIALREEMKVTLRQEMRQEMLNMLALHKQGTMNQVIFENDFSMFVH